MKVFKDKERDITYEMTKDIPPIGPGTLAKVRMLTMYAGYRNGLFNTRIAKPLDDDIAVYPHKFKKTEGEKVSEEAQASSHKPTADESASLYQYSSWIAIDAMQELFKKPDAQCCIAYKQIGRHKTTLGFIVFYEKVVNDEVLLYISHVSVNALRQGVGTKLIQSVLMSYPTETKFYLCVRTSNEGAIKAYNQLGFDNDPQPVEAFGYNRRYFVGMSHVTRAEEIAQLRMLLPEEALQADYEPYLSSKSF